MCGGRTWSCGLRRNQAMLGRQKSSLIYPGRPVSTNPASGAGRLWHGIGGWYRQGARDDERRRETQHQNKLFPRRALAWRWRLAPWRLPPSLRALAINVLHMPLMQAHWARLHLSAVERVRDSNGNDVSSPVSSSLPVFMPTLQAIAGPSTAASPAIVAPICSGQWAPVGRPSFHPHHPPLQSSSSIKFPAVTPLGNIFSLPRLMEVPCAAPLTLGRRHNQQLALPHLSQTEVSSSWLREGVAVCCPPPPILAGIISSRKTVKP